MSTDDTLTRLIRDEGSRKGVFGGVHRDPARAATASRNIERLKALRSYERAKAALTAAGIRIEDAEAEVARAVSR